MNPLFTIGHSSHSIDAFRRLLLQHEVQAVADVRSYPWSNRYPWFNRMPLSNTLKAERISYVFLGDELGARREEPSCYEEGAVSYDRVAQTHIFAAGLMRLKKGLYSHRIALLCAEKEPLDCHRTILVSRHARGFAVIQHILFDGALEPHEMTENRLLSRFGFDPNDLFTSRDEMLAKAYSRRGQEIAYLKPKLPVHGT